MATGTDRRFVERRLDVGEGVRILGTARYDTTVSRAAGQVNAAIGVDERARAAGRLGWLRYRLFGDPFVISDRAERELGVRAGALGIGAIVAATAALWVVITWVT